MCCYKRLSEQKFAVNPVRRDSLRPCGEAPTPEINSKADYVFRLRADGMDKDAQMAVSRFHQAINGENVLNGLPDFDLPVVALETRNDVQDKIAMARWQERAKKQAAAFWRDWVHLIQRYLQKMNTEEKSFQVDWLPLPVVLVMGTKWHFAVGTVYASSDVERFADLVFTFRYDPIDSSDPIDCFKIITAVSHMVNFAGEKFETFIKQVVPKPTKVTMGSGRG